MSTAISTIDTIKLKFALGQLVATPGAIEALSSEYNEGLELVMRHAAGDFGDVCTEDAALNSEAIREGYRILSAYTTRSSVKVWIITEADRSVTTILLPEEY